MALDAKKVYAPTPDQSPTTGAVAVADTGVTAPTDAGSVLPSANWDEGGYVSEDGISLTVTRSTTPIRDWSKSVVRNLLTEFGGSIVCNFLQVDEFAAECMFGEDNVTVTAATQTHGAQMKVGIGATLPPIKAFCFSMKDGDARVRVFVPRGQFTDVNQIDFKPDAGLTFGGTIQTYDDGTGNSVYVMFDDGTVISG